MRALLVLALYALAWPVFSQTLSCTAPTKNTDGSSITGSLTFRFYRGNVRGRYTQVSPPQSTCAYTFTSGAGNYFAVTATNSAGAESVFSVSAPAPVTVAGPVFNLAVTMNSLVVLEAGSAVAGKACDETQKFDFGGKTYMRVNVADVTAFPGQQVIAAWAVCP